MYHVLSLWFEIEFRLLWSHSCNTKEPSILWNLLWKYLKIKRGGGGSNRDADMEEKGETTEHYLLEKCGESNSTERSQRPQELVVHKISQFDDVAFPCSPRLNPPPPPPLFLSFHNTLLSLFLLPQIWFFLLFWFWFHTLIKAKTL